MGSAPAEPRVATSRRPVRTVFFGSGPFALPILDALVADPDVEVVGVVSAPDRPAGRRAEPTPTPVSRRAIEGGLTIFRPPDVRTPDVIAEIAAFEPEVGVLADFGRIIPPALLGVPRRGILNVHPSLLPRHRGAAPVPATILAGDETAGVTIIVMDAGLDTGPILAAEAWPLAGSETGPELEARAAAAGAALLVRSLAGWLDGTLAARPQAAEGATLTRPLRRGDGRLDPDRPAAELERQVRAYQPWPGSFVETSAGRLVVWRATVAAATVAAEKVAAGTVAETAGCLVAHGRGVALATRAGLPVLEEVQLAGRRRTGAEELLRGRPGLIGEAVA